MADDDRSVLIQDAALVLGVSRRTIYNRIKEGRLVTVRTRGGSQRVMLWSIKQLLDRRRRVNPAAPAGATAEITARDGDA